jgi:hypothetical protein
VRSLIASSDFANADHEGAVGAMLKGVAEHGTDKPGFYIHTSGTGLLLWDNLKSQIFGEASDKVYDDMDGLHEVTAFPDEAPHRKTDKMVLSTGADHGDRAKTAIVAPPTIYGIGRGPDNKRSHQLPELARLTLEKGHGIQVGSGKALWSNVHVHDLSALYLKLVENAAAGGSLAEWPDKPSLWGGEAYYFSENNVDHQWGQIGHLVAVEAKKQGLVDTETVESVTAEEAMELTIYGHVTLGGNSRSRAKRARELLGWNPSAPSIEEEVQATVEFEARKLGMRPGHSKVAAGDA